MPRRRKPNEQDSSARDLGSSVPDQQDEADILAEVGGTRDEGGELIVDEDAVLALGAVDAESVRANRRMDNVVNKKRGGEKNLTFNTDDLLTMYEGVIRVWAPNTLDISVRRLTGSAITRVITSRPRSGVELYEAIKTLHGPHEEAEYEVKFLDTNRKLYRGTGRITMPDTRVAPQQGQQPMYHPNGAPPPAYAPPQPGFASPPPPTFPASSPSIDPMAMMNQMFQLFQQMQASVQPAPQPQAPPQFQVPPAMPPMPSPQASLAEQMEWMQRAFGMFKQMTTAPAQQAAPPASAAPQTPQSGMAESIATMREMFTLFQQMQGGSGAGSGPSRPRPPYYPRDDQGDPRTSPFSPSARQPQRPPQTMAEQFRESIGVVRTAVSMVEEMDSLLPGRHGQQQDAHVPQEADDDDSPIKIIDTGAGKIAVNREDGSMRLWESGFANLGDILKWGGEQIQKINKTNAERQRAQQPQRRLPPGYVEVGPDYRPPPGYVAVPVDQPQEGAEEELPPPPENPPPPIDEPAPPVRQAWGAPIIPNSSDQ